MSDKFQQAVLCIFARAPVPGTVKTRLHGALGARAACDCHQQLMTTCIERMQSGQWHQQLWSTDLNNAYIQEINARYDLELQQQQGDDLGMRMQHAVIMAAQRSPFVVIIGTDCPVIEVDYINQAVTRLQQDAEVVLGPAEDGGYVLVGVNSERITAQQLTHLFADIPWGSDKVLAVTRQRLSETQCRWHELNTLWDVDNPADYQRWQSLFATVQ